MPDTPYYFHVFKGTDGQWYWRFMAPNEQVVAEGGEGYTTYGKCIAGLNLMAVNASGATIKSDS